MKFWCNRLIFLVFCMIKQRPVATKTSMDTNILMVFAHGANVIEFYSVFLRPQYNTCKLIKYFKSREFRCLKICCKTCLNKISTGGVKNKKY